jgi:hypothetical protein
MFLLFFGGGGKTIGITRFSVFPNIPEKISAGWKCIEIIGETDCKTNKQRQVKKTNQFCFACFFFLEKKQELFWMQISILSLSVTLFLGLT